MVRAVTNHDRRVAMKKTKKNRAVLKTRKVKTTKTSPCHPS
jgi:hypothetical protein